MSWEIREYLTLDGYHWDGFVSASGYGNGRIYHLCPLMESSPCEPKMCTTWVPDGTSMTLTPPISSARSTKRPPSLKLRVCMKPISHYEPRPLEPLASIVVRLVDPSGATGGWSASAKCHAKPYEQGQKMTPVALANR